MKKITKKDFSDYFFYELGALDDIIQNELKNRLPVRKEKKRIINKRSIKRLIDNAEKHFGKETNRVFVVNWFVSQFNESDAKYLTDYRLFLEWRKVYRKSEFKGVIQELDI